jgi:hypothetical protein
LSLLIIDVWEAITAGQSAIPSLAEKSSAPRFLSSLT